MERANPRYTIATVVEFKEDIRYKYWVNDTVHTAYTSAYGQSSNKAQLENHNFIIQFNEQDPNYSIIFFKCEVADSIQPPDAGWLTLPDEYKDCATELE